MRHALVVVVDAYHVGIPVVNGLKGRALPNVFQQNRASSYNLIFFARWQGIHNLEFTLFLYISGILPESIELIAKILHLFSGKVIDFCLVFIDFQLHIFGKILGNAVSKSFGVAMFLTQYQNVISITHMDSDFQVRSSKVRASIPVIMKFAYRFVMPAIALVSQPNIKSM
jgi:hypothetical protein